MTHRLRRLVPLLLALLAACTTLDGELRTRPHAGSGTLQAGAAVVDVTPVPGFPMGGHALEARSAVAVWTDLHARALYLEDAAGTPLVFLVADLWAVSAGLADTLADRFAHVPELAHIGREHLILSATHTHHGPGNFASHRVYNRHASNLPGFDPALFDFLATRMVDAVRRAHAARVPARLVHGSGTIPAAARNRSLDAFMRDPEARPWLDTHGDLPPCPDEAPGEPMACRAVDPTAHVLVARARDDDRLLAVAGFFPVHATAMPNHTEAYHGDVFGLAAERLSRALADGDDETSPVVLLLNGPEGDVSPNWTEQGPLATRTVAGRMAEGVARLVGTASDPVTGPFHPHYARERLAGRRLTTGTGPLATAARPLSGRSQLVGAEDGPTVFRRLGWREGMALPEGVFEAMPGQGRKLPALPVPLQLLELQPGVVPEHVPLGVIEAGGIAFATLPGEFTTILGQRIRAGLSSAMGRDEPVVLVGLAGEYLGYFTTGEEYDAQHYEGASMMYGRDAGAMVAALLARVVDQAPRVPPTFRYHPGSVRRFGMTTDRTIRRLAAGAENRLRAQLHAPDLASFSFTTPPPIWPPPLGTRALPAARLRATGDEPDHFLDDEVALVVVAATNHTWTWRALALPAEPLASPGDVTFRVELAGGEILCSEPLRPGTPLAPAPCPTP